MFSDIDEGPASVAPPVMVTPSAAIMVAINFIVRLHVGFPDGARVRQSGILSINRAPTRLN
jgi:hypothetical protein